MSKNQTVLDESRRKFVEMVTQTVRQSAKVLEDEQNELKRRFPAMAHQASPVMFDPTVINDFTKSEEYHQAVEAYIAGRLEVNLLVKVMELLRKVAPIEFLM